MMNLNFTDGWQRKTLRLSCASGLVRVLIGIFFVFISAQAGAQGQGEMADEITSDDLALLEFLGDWETDAGEWIDPLLFDDEASGGKRAVSDGASSGASNNSGAWKVQEMKQEMKREKTQSPLGEEGRK